MLRTEQKWEPCYADTSKGVAFFDGIVIETDSINDARWDRVFPIIPEEQILMCRAMKSRGFLHPRLKILDIGTGSGVFAIWAAAHGGEVTAIDICNRAIRFASHNISNQTNQTAIATSGGEVQLIRGDIKDYAQKCLESHEFFDLIFLNPPFNPTAPGIYVARHAYAGVLGQDQFNVQIPLALNLLKPGGTAIGVQMALHRRSNAASWWRDDVLKKHFPKDIPIEKWHLEYAPILEAEEYPAREFLEKQYEHFLNPWFNLDPRSENIHKYICNVFKPEHHDLIFGFYYYEISRLTDESSYTNSRSPVVAPFNLTIRPHTKWNERIRLHRDIIEHTSDKHSLPAPSIFLDYDNTPKLPTSLKKDLFGDTFESSALSTLLRWIIQTQLIGDRENDFDLVLIDSSPWFDTWEGRRAINSEVVVCCKNSILPDPADFVVSYYRTVRSLQERFLAPFLHPCFSGASNPQERRALHHDTVHVNEEPNLPSKAVEWLKELEESFSNLKNFDQSGSTRSIAPDVLKQYGVSASYSSQSLATLAVPDVIKYNKRIKDDYGLKPDPKVLYDDLELIHITFHNRLRTILTDIIKIANYPVSSGLSSMFMGIPLSMAFSQTEPNIEKLPNNYRGGLWIFAANIGRIRPREEALLFDLARLSTITLYSAVSASATSALACSLRRMYQTNLAHEVRDLIGAISLESDEKMLEILRGSFRMMAISPREFENSNPRHIWNRLKAECRPGFAKGDTFGGFVSNHWNICKEIEEMRLMLKNKNFKFEPPEIHVCSEMAVISSYYQADNESAKIKAIIFLSLTLVSALRNLLLHADNREPIKIDVQDGNISIINKRLVTEEHPNKRGTEGVLRGYAREYLSSDDANIYFDRCSDINYWKTEFPLPYDFFYQ